MRRNPFPRTGAARALLGPGLVVGGLLAGTATAQWQTAQLLNASSESGQDCKTPKVVGSINGGFHACWSNNAGTVRYRRYTTSLQTPVTALTDFNFNPWLAEALNGDIHIVYEDWTGDTPEVGWVRSTNGGTSFSSPTEISSSGGVAKFPMIAPYGTGSSDDIVMSYWNTSNKDLRYRYWNGSSWGSDSYVGSDGGSEYEVFGIARSPLDGSVWRSFDNGDWVALRRYNGSSWDSTVNLYNQGFFARQRVAVNDAGQVMVMWDMTFLDGNYYSIVYTPGVGVGPRQVVSSEASWGTAVTAIPGTNDFYTVYAKGGASRIIGRRWSNGSWGSEELVSVGLANDFTPNPDVAADPNGSGTLYAVWEYWASGKPQIYYSIKPGSGPPPPPPYQASLVSLSAPSTMAAGSTATVTVTYTNTGTQTWNNSTTRLGTSNARDRNSPFYNSADWISANRPTACDQSSVAPSGTGTFTFIAKAPTTPGNYTEKFELVQDGVTWFDGTGDDVTWNVTVTAVPGAITGTVTSGGSPLSGATVSTNTGGYSTTTNGSGQYTLSNVAPGTYTVTASKSGYNSNNVPGVVVTSGSTTSNVNIALTPQPGAITGTVTSNGSPVSGATVSTNTGGYSTTTNGSGQYTLSNVAPGTYNVTAAKTGYTSDTENGVVVNPGATTSNINLTLVSNTPTDYIQNGSMEGGFWSTGWGGGSAIPNGWDGWHNPGDFNCFQESSVKHGGSYAARTTISSGGSSGSGGYKRGIVQFVELPANSTFTITVWARHTNGNCPSIMCWNPGEDANPETAYANGRYQWVTTDNWGQLNTWVSRTMSGTAPSTGVITVIVGGAHHGGGGTGTVYIDDVTVVAP